MLLTTALVIPALMPALPADSYADSPLKEFLSPSAVSVAPAAQADADSILSYTYAEVGVAQNDIDAIDDDVETYYLRGSLNLLGFLYLFGEYANQSTDFNDTDADLYTLGAGAHFGVLPNLDLLAEVGVLFNDVSSDFDDIDDSETGYRAIIGARWLVLPFDRGGIELNGGVGTIDLDNRLGSEEDPFIWLIGARVHFLKFLSVGATYEQQEDDEQILGNVRFSF